MVTSSNGILQTFIQTDPRLRWPWEAIMLQFAQHNTRKKPLQLLQHIDIGESVKWPKEG